ncbi:MAG: 30S ribosomal protein S6 [Cyanobacteriota bacterium]|nr:30S ribosomal protein S6 [Cyanobacteriota bacterium]
MPRPYETMLIVRPDVVDEPLAQLLNAQKEILQEGGATTVETQIKGKRRFTYEMKGHKEGLYVLVNYQADPAAVQVWEKGLRLNETILRFMTLNLEK